MIPPHIAALVRSATDIAVLTGSGVSAESGIPTFRDALTGLWENYRPEELATVAGFRRDPQLVWSWYRMRRLAIAAALPNPGHHALARLARLVPRLTLTTQNVDGLHQRAGSEDVIELHGNIGRVQCADCSRPVDPCPEVESVPSCPVCGGLLRPDVVWFGEFLPPIAMDRAQTAAESCDLFLSIGTSNLVEPAASLPWIAARHGSPVVVVNTSDEGQRTGPTIHHLLGRAGDVLPALVAAAWPHGEAPARG
jgi:NAD-dependent deacetylase